LEIAGLQAAARWCWPRVERLRCSSLGASWAWPAEAATSARASSRGKGLPARF